MRASSLFHGLRFGGKRDASSSGNCVASTSAISCFVPLGLPSSKLRNCFFEISFTLILCFSATLLICRLEQTHHMTPRRERAGAFDNASIPRQFGHQMRRNKIAELAQEREAAARWLVRCGFIHSLPCGRFTRCKPTLFYPSTRKPAG